MLPSVCSVNQISEQGRATQGVKLIRVDEGDEIAAITQLDEKEVEEENPIDENGAAPETPVADGGTDLPPADTDNNNEQAGGETEMPPIVE